MSTLAEILATSAVLFTLTITRRTATTILKVVVKTFSMLSHPTIQYDLQHAAQSTISGVYGFLTAAPLSRTPSTLSNSHRLPLLSCDNLQGNGILLWSKMLTAFAQMQAIPRAWDVGLLEQVASSPTDMVDRITPATTPVRYAKCSAIGLSLILMMPFQSLARTLFF